MSTEIGQLVAKFLADTSHFDRGIVGVEKGISRTTGALGKLGLQSTVLGGILGTLGSRVQGISTLTSELGGRMGLLGIGMGVVSAVGIGLGISMFKLAKYAADAGDEIFDLTQKVNFSAESISALKNAGETAGVEFGSLSSALGIFNKNVELVNQGDEKLSRTFRVLKIDIRDNETALRSAFKALLNVKDGSQQGALAMQIFGRSGKEVLGIIKATNGDLDAAIKRYQELGTLIGTDAAEAANKFSDQLKELEQKLQGVARTVGQRFMPTVVDALNKINAALDSNRGHAKSWADDLVSVFSFAATQIGHILQGLSLVIEGFRKTFGEGSIVGDAIKGETNRKTLNLPDGRVIDLGTRETFDLNNPADKRRFFGLPSEPEGEFAIAGGAGQYSTGAGGQPSRGKGGRVDLGGGGGGKGGGGEDPAKTAQRIAALQLDAVIAGLQAEQDANKRALDLRRRDFNAYATQYMVIENRRHDAVIAGLDKEQAAAEKLKSGRALALQEISNKRVEENTTHEQNRNRVLDERGKILDQINDFLRDQEREISGLTTSTDQWDQAYQQFVDTLKEEGVTLEANHKTRIESNIAILKEIDLVKQQIRVRQVLLSIRERFATRAGNDRAPWIDLGGGSTVGGEPGTTTRGRVVTADEQVMRDQLEMIRGKMRDLGFELTDIVSQGVGDGFRRGINSGLETLSLGLLRIVEDVFLRRMAQGLSEMLAGIGTSSGGGFLGGLLRSVVGAAAGGIGGIGGGSAGGLGSAFAGAFASGGMIPMGQWGIVHENEKVFAGPRGAQVIPSVNGGAQKTEIHNHYTINLPPDSRGSYSSPKSNRQLSETLLAALQAANT